MSHIFISYSSKDRRFADQIISILRTNHLTPWIAPDSIPAGSDYPSSIVNAIKSADAVVLLLSADSLNSVWVKNEIETAVNHGKRVFPVQIDNAPLTPAMELMISSMQTVPFRDLCENKSTADRFLAAIRGPQKKKKKPAGFYVLVSVAVILFALVVFGFFNGLLTDMKDLLRPTASLYVNDCPVSFPLQYSRAKLFFGLDENDSGYSKETNGYFYTYNTNYGYKMIFWINGTPPEDQKDYEFDGIAVEDESAEITLKFSNGKAFGISPGMMISEVEKELGEASAGQNNPDGSKYMEFYYKDSASKYCVGVVYQKSGLILRIICFKMS